MELVPLATAALGVLGGIVRLLNTGVKGGGAAGKKGGRGADDDVKLTLTPPLFERHRDRNAFVRSPLDTFDLHRLALFSHFFADRHVLIATAQLQPVQNSNYHDVEALIRVPTTAWPFGSSSGAAAAALPSSSFFSSHVAASHPSSSTSSPTPSSPLSPPPPYPAAVASSSPIADAVIRVQPSPSEPTFLQVALSTANGGVANAIGCYSLTSLLGSKATASTSPQAAVFFQAPLFSSDRYAVADEPFTPPDGAAVGLRVDHLGTSAGVSVSPFQLSKVNGWLSSSTFLSASQGTALRGGCSFRADTNALSSLRGGADGLSQAVQVDGKLSFVQMVDVDVDAVSPTHAPVPAYEVGLTLKNGGEELVTSVFNHLVLRRRVYNLWEDKRVVGITQYVDLGMELAMRKTGPPSWRVAAAWQLNKGLLLKTRLSDSTASAAVALKSWQSPNTTVSAALHYQYSGRMQVGLTFALENVGAVLFGRAPLHYTRTVNTRRKDVTYEWQEEQQHQ